MDSTTHNVFDAETFDAIADLLGPEKTWESLTKFKVELESRLSRGDLAPSGHEPFRRDAHVVTSIAGLLGFEELAQRCAAVVSAPADAPDDFEAKGAEVLTAKARTMARLQALIASYGEAAVAA